MTKFLLDTLDTVVNVVFIFSGFGLAVIPLNWEIKKLTLIQIKEQIDFKTENKVFTPMGKVFIVCFGLAVASGLSKYYLDSKSMSAMKDGILKLTVAHANDSTQKIIDDRERKIVQLESKQQVKIVEKKVDSANSILNAKNFQYENLSLKLQEAQKNSDFLQSEFNSPILSYSRYYDNSLSPHLTKDTITGRLAYWIYYKNSGKGIAKNIRTTSVVLSFEGGSLKVEDLGLGDLNDKGNIAEPGVPYGYAKFFHPTDIKKEFVCFEAKYQNALGQERSPYRVIYYYDADLVDKEMPIIPNQIKELIEEYLIKNGFWK